MEVRILGPSARFSHKAQTGRAFITKVTFLNPVAPNGCFRHAESVISSLLDEVLL